jgi:ABC-type multidrug transport system fused ATPase/permease subunit
VQVIVIIGLLISTMGVSALAGLAVTFLMSPVQGHFMRKTQMLRGDIAKKTDARVKLMNEILQGIRVLKVYAWENSFMAKLAGVRQQEMDIVMESAILRAIYSAMMMTGPTLMSVAAFIVYGATTEQVTAQAIFSALVYFNQRAFSSSRSYPRFPQVDSLCVDSSLSPDDVADVVGYVL